MKAVTALVIVAAFSWIGFSLADPLYNVAALHLCSAHAEENGLELVDYEGAFVYRAKRVWFTRTTPAYWCEFQDPRGNTILLDEQDRSMRVTWTSRGLRFASWILIIAPLIGAIGVSHALGLLKRGD